MEDKKLIIKKVEIKMKNGNMITQPINSGDIKRSSRYPFEDRQPYHWYPERFEK